MKLLLTAVGLLPLLSFSYPAKPEWYPPYPPAYDESQIAIAPARTIPPRPVCPVHVIRMRVTACSPQDPDDVEYYTKNGYQGATYNIAAHLGRFPKGTRMRVPGYMKSRGNVFWVVDSSGGSVIRRSHARGIPHIDVKFATVGTVRKWGSQMLDVEVIYPGEYKAWQEAAAAWDAAYAR